MIPISICLFRNDLRVADHEPLWQAARAGKPVVGVYVFERTNYGTTRVYEFPKTGSHRAAFIRQAVDELRQQLAQVGIPLVVRFGDTAEVLATLVADVQEQGYAPDAVYYSHEFGSEEQQVIAQAKQHNPNLAWHAYWTKGMFPLAALPSLDAIPDQFTRFRHQVEGKLTVPEPLPAPQVEAAEQADVFASLNHDAWTQLPTWDALGVAEPAPSARATMLFLGGVAGATARLHAYLYGTDAIATYKETRNGLLHADDSTRLSPWLAHGCMSVRQICAELRTYERTRTKNESTYWFFFELLWREFFLIMHMKYGDDLFKRSGIQHRTKPWLTDPARMQQWVTGRTGYPLVDASMHELAETGYTTNRARQNAASFLAQTWQIDWRFGAEVYESLLIDYEPAVNYGNWQYLAGVGNDSRQDRWFDVVKQAKQYDPEGAYVAHWR